MKLTFTRSTQEEADALRALIEETVSNEKTGYANRDDAFEVSADASLKTFGTGWSESTKKRWEFTVSIEDSTNHDDAAGNHVEHFRWAKLFERLINRPAVKRGTQVRVQRPLNHEQVKFLRGNKTEPEAVEQRFMEYLNKNADRHLYRDSEDHYVKATGIAVDLEMEGEMETFVILNVDAVDAPIADAVLGVTVDDIERDRERAHPSGTAGGGT